MVGCEITTRSYNVATGTASGGGKLVQVIAVHGFVDAHTYSELAEVLNGLIAEGNYSLILDLKKLEYISSAGFTVLLATVRRVREKQGDLRLVNLPPKIRKIADVLGCSSIIKIFDDPKEALASFKV
ncbi:STAS domain-containing protein [candidate division NPL-UPA2 bacterium]|nr:STAS domain-containing protein [candidate division NPL-UPA2 bacterium]